MDRDRLPRALERPQQTFSGKAVDVLRDMVLSGQLRVGERLNEVELANALGISRGPLREAIQRLHSEGLLTTVSGRGAFVRTFTADALRELYEVRIALETHAVRLAATNLDPDGVQELHQMLQEADQALIAEQAYPKDLDFHQRIVALADNQALLETTIKIHRQIHLARSRSGHVSLRAGLQEHQAVLEHVANGDAEKAAHTLTEHLRSCLQRTLEVFDSKAAADGSGGRTDASGSQSVRGLRLS